MTEPPRGVGSNSPGRDNLIDATLAYWNPRYGGTLTREDAHAILDNLVGLFDLLDRLHTRGNGRPAVIPPRVVAPDPPPPIEPAENDLQPLWSVKRVATYCCVSTETVRRWRRRGQLRPAGQTPDGKWLFDPRDVKATLGVEERRQGLGPPAPSPSSAPPVVTGERDPRDPRRPYACHIVDSKNGVLRNVEGFSNKVKGWVDRNRGKRLPTRLILEGLRRDYPDIARSRVGGMGFSTDLKRLSDWLGIKLEGEGKGGRIWVL